MDPHALALLYHSRVGFQVYDSLVNRGRDFALEPSLALSWQAVDPRTWRFTLRPGVRFHDGTPFTADDAVFSIERAMAPTSQRAFQLKGVTGATKVDELTVDVQLATPDAVLPEKLLLIGDDEQGLGENTASRRRRTSTPSRRPTPCATPTAPGRSGWSATSPTCARCSRASRAGGAGPTSARQPGAGELAPIKSDATRLAALASGEVDLVLDPPFQDVARLKREAADAAPDRRHRPAVPHLRPVARRTGAQRREGPQPVQGPARAPGRRTTRSTSTLIVAKVLRGQAAPTGPLLSTARRRLLPELDKRLPYDPAKARALLRRPATRTAFGHARLRERRLARERLPGAPAMLTQVGIRATFRRAHAPQFFPKLSQATASFIEFGWTPDDRRLAAAQRAVPHVRQGRPRHVQRRPLQQSEARRADRRHPRRARPDAPPRLVGVALRMVGDDLPLHSALPAHADLGDAQEGRRGHWPNDMLELRCRADAIG